MKKIFLFLLISIVFESCYYDNFEELNPAVNLNQQCDSAATMSYSTHVAPLISNYCISCHDAATASGNVVLDNYNGVKTNSAKLLGCIKHLSGYNSMPPNVQLNDCTIREIEKWIQSGTPNN